MHLNADFNCIFEQHMKVALWGYAVCFPLTIFSKKAFSMFYSLQSLMQS